LNQVNNGAWAFGYNSKFTHFYTLKDQTILSYQTGWITNQTWAANNQTYIPGVPEISIGYTTWTTSDNQVYLNSTKETFEFPIDQLSFGQLNYEGGMPTSGFFETLSNSTTVLFALN